MFGHTAPSFCYKWQKKKTLSNYYFFFCVSLDSKFLKFEFGLKLWKTFFQNPSQKNVDVLLYFVKKLYKIGRKTLVRPGNSM